MKNLEPLYFDARYIRVGHHDGISRFSAGLCAALSTQIKVIAIINDERQLEKLPAGIEFVRLSDPTHAVSELFIASKLNRLGAKLVFSPMQTMGKLGRKYKLIVTLHDLIYYAHPAPPPSFSWPIRLGWRLFHLTYLPQRIMLNGADAVATVSETTKRLMVKNRLTRRPIQVVHNAADMQPLSATKPTKNQLVYMGSYMDYKNVECLISAMKLLPDFQLHLLSKISPQRKNELTDLAGKSANQVIFHNGVTDGEYRELLSESFALVSASRDEGFGIPVIEAMRLGIPAVISDIEIFREIGGAAAHYFDPNDPSSLARQIESLQGKWNQTSKKSKIQAAKFSWESSAKELIAAIEAL